MKKLKTQKGITLIALIITIVVLLILAGVTIGTLKESNIIGRAKDTVSSYESGKEEENVLLTQMEETLNKYVQGINKNDKNDLEELTEYLLGKNKEGRNLFEIYDEDTGFKPDPNNDNSTIYTKLKVSHTETESSTETESIILLYVRYNGAIYKVRCSFKIIDPSTIEIEVKTLKDGVVLVEYLEGNLGKYVKYANNTWIVLTDDDSGVELISANALGSINFICSTPEEARIEYNNIINSLVDKCKEETGITTNIRSVGSYKTEEETLSDRNTVVFKDLGTFSPEVDYSNFSKFEGAQNGFRKGDLDYETDYNKMKKIGILEADNGLQYWLASRFVYEHNDARSSYINFEVRFVYYNSVWEQNICSVEEMASSNIGYACDENDYRAVRPIVMMDPGTLDNVTQSGDKDDPIILN